MTTLAALATKDALVMGCDSLGSVTKRVVDPFDLVKDFFEPSDNSNIKRDKDGTPVLKNFIDILDKAQIIPYNNMGHVDKLYPLLPLEMGIMATGIASTGNYTTKNMINHFKSNDETFKAKEKPKNYTVNSIASRLLKFMNKFYEKEFGDKVSKPELEMIIGGSDD